MGVHPTPLPRPSAESNVLAKHVQKILKTSKDETAILAYELDKEKDSEEYLDLEGALLDYEKNEKTIEKFLNSVPGPLFALKGLSAPGSKARERQIAKSRRAAAEFSRSKKRFAVFIRLQDLKKLAEEDDDDDLPAGTRVIGRPYRERADEGPKYLCTPPPITQPSLPLGSCSFATSPSERLKEFFQKQKK